MAMWVERLNYHSKVHKLTHKVIFRRVRSYCSFYLHFEPRCNDREAVSFAAYQSITTLLEAGASAPESTQLYY